MKLLGPINEALDLVSRDATSTVVVHGSTAGTARPTGAGSVTWIGSVTPTNANTATDIWIDTSVSAPVGVQTGSYVPTLAGMAPGTGGTNTAEYTFVGGTNVGDQGLLSVSGEVIFGTSGQTFPTSPTVSLPSGFELIQTSFLYPFGLALLTNAGVFSYQGKVRPQNATSFGIVIDSDTPSPYLNYLNVTTTTPFTWGQDDHIRYSFNGVRVVRV